MKQRGIVQTLFGWFMVGTVLIYAAFIEPDGPPEPVVNTEPEVVIHQVLPPPQEKEDSDEAHGPVDGNDAADEAADTGGDGDSGRAVDEITAAPSLPSVPAAVEPHTSTAASYTPRVIQYSPSWNCRWCGPQRRELESIHSPPFDVEYITKDGLGSYPQVWFSTPDGGWKRWQGYQSAANIMADWRKYHDCPAESQTSENAGNPKYERTLSLPKLQAMDASQLRQAIREWGTSLPTSGTVVGMTVTHHLVRDHGFDPGRISGLSDGERHSIHQIAHNISDGRTTARTRTVTTPTRQQQTIRWRTRRGRR